MITVLARALVIPSRFSMTGLVGSGFPPRIPSPTLLSDLVRKPLTGLMTPLLLSHKGQAPSHIHILALPPTFTPYLTLLNILRPIKAVHLWPPSLQYLIVRLPPFALQANNSADITSHL